MNSPDGTKLCTTCGTFRPVDQFGFSKTGRPYKTCTKHGRKRTHTQISVDDWDFFLRELGLWSKPSQTEAFDRSFVFDLDQLPTPFDSLPNSTGVDPALQVDAARTNESIGELVRAVWMAGGHRFRQHTSAARTLSSRRYHYVCLQDKAHTSYSAKGIRHRTHQECFPCRSKLTLQVNFHDRRLEVTLQHSWHALYEGHTEADKKQAHIISWQYNCLHATEGEEDEGGGEEGEQQKDEAYEEYRATEEAGTEVQEDMEERGAVQPQHVNTQPVVTEQDQDIDRESNPTELSPAAREHVRIITTYAKLLSEQLERRNFQSLEMLARKTDTVTKIAAFLQLVEKLKTMDL